MHIIPIASGKGGVGKSLLAANLSIALAQAEKKVILVDLDLGGSNLHLILGIRAVTQGLGSFLFQNVPLEKLLINTDIPNLRFLPGDSEIPGMANIKNQQKTKLLKSIRQLDSDYLILDLGAGTSINTVDSFLLSNRGIVVTTPTLTATLNAYFFLKNVVFRLLDTSFKKGSWAREQFNRLMSNSTQVQKLYLPRFMEAVEDNDPESAKHFFDSIKKFQPRLVFNMLEKPEDAERAARVRRSCREYLGLDLDHLGVIYRDELQDIALNSRLPILLYKPQSVLSQAIYRIAEKILSQEGMDETPMDWELFEESFQIANQEAEEDFEAKFQYLQDLLDTGALSMGDLIETVKIQQLEINQLRKENLLLKSKVVKAIQAGVKL
jgi:flagellar biosynthesis protein FlhG